MNKTPRHIEQVLRLALSGKTRKEVAKKMGWDDSQISRFLSGQQGVTIDKLDMLVASVDYVLVTKRYLDAIGTLSEVGVHCQCARDGHGECGKQHGERIL